MVLAGLILYRSVEIRSFLASVSRRYCGCIAEVPFFAALQRNTAQQAGFRRRKSRFGRRVLQGSGLGYPRANWTDEAQRQNADDC